jgi:uncharacterized protein (UPF0332 family)
MMNFDWDDFLGFAKEIYKYRNSSYYEARLRSVISRAYYAAFIKSRNHIRYKDKVYIPTNQNAHLFVINYFINDSDSFRSRIGQRLDAMRTNRNMADYDNRVNGLARLATDTLKSAEYIIKDLDNL